VKPLYGDLAPFLNFFLNNLGDAYAKSNYAISTQDLELEVIEKFTEVRVCGRAARAFGEAGCGARVPEGGALSWRGESV
jgi:hypothetical protein